MMRELLRSIARASMKRRGVTRMNKKMVVTENGKAVKGPSLFARNWRKEAAFALSSNREMVEKSLAEREGLLRRRRGRRVRA